MNFILHSEIKCNNVYGRQFDIGTFNIFHEVFSFLSAPTDVSQSEHSDGQSRAGQGKCGTCELLSDRHRFLHLFSEQMRPILTRT